MPVSCAAHRGIRRTTFNDDTEAAVGNTMDNCGFGEADDAFVIACFEEGLCQYALLPVAPFHGQSGQRGFLNATVSVCRIIRNGNA